MVVVHPVLHLHFPADLWDHQMVVEMVADLSGLADSWVVVEAFLVGVPFQVGNQEASDLRVVEEMELLVGEAWEALEAWVGVHLLMALQEASA